MATLARPPPLIDPWPPLELAGWKDTRDTLQRCLQIAGKLRIALTPPTNHWWNAGLQLTARGLTTLALPWRGGAFELAFDLIDHEVVLQTSWDDRHIHALGGQTVADFYRELLAALRAMGVEPEIWDVPVEVTDRTPLHADTHHAAYDPDAVRRFFQVLLSVHNVLDRFRAGFTGKASPVQFYWGGCDLSVSLYSGRGAPPREGDAILRESSTEEYFSVGFWPGDERYPDAAFFAYCSPEPEEFRDGNLAPAAATYEPRLGEFILPYQAVRQSPDPDKTLLSFCESAYHRAASLARWDRAKLERPLILPKPRSRPFDAEEPAPQGG
ncbi:MAG: hypothetical protein IRZ16_17065 [Myxococcaceae bacterium]|nr:hypothetical protein [Myxococcaceae bacterium]